MTKRLFQVECEWSPDVSSDEEFQDRELPRGQQETKKKARRSMIDVNLVDPMLFHSRWRLRCPSWQKLFIRSRKGEKCP